MKSVKMPVKNKKKSYKKKSVHIVQHVKNLKCEYGDDTLKMYRPTCHVAGYKYFGEYYIYLPNIK